MGRLIEWKLGNDNRAVQPGSPARRSRAAQRPSAILATRFNGGVFGEPSIGHRESLVFIEKAKLNRRHGRALLG